MGPDTNEGMRELLEWLGDAADVTAERRAEILGEWADDEAALIACLLDDSEDTDE